VLLKNYRMETHKKRTLEKFKHLRFSSVKQDLIITKMWNVDSSQSCHHSIPLWKFTLDAPTLFSSPSVDSACH